MKSNEWRRNCVHKSFKIEIQKWGPNNSDFLQNWFPPEIRVPLLNLKKFRISEKSTPESCRMNRSVMNDDEILSIKIFKLKYRRVDHIIQTFFKIVSSQKLCSPALIYRNFKSPGKVLLNHAECIKI